MAAAEAAAEAVWSREENKIFENALVQFPEEVAGRWLKIAGCLDGKTMYDVVTHYNALLRDVKDIEDGFIQLPPYRDFPISGAGAGRGSQSALAPKRKKGRPWTESEHMLFLIGLKKYGRGDWRNISRNVVKTRCPSQVASHAQKYFIRLEQDKKKRKRSSIHDTQIATDLAELDIHLSDPDSSPYTPRNNHPSPLPYPYPGPTTLQSPYTTPPGMSSNLVQQLPYTPNNVGMSSNLYPPTIQSSPYMSVDKMNNLYPSREQPPYTPLLNVGSVSNAAGMVSNPYLLTEQSSYITPSNTAGMASNMYLAADQSPYATSNTYTSSEQSPSSTDSLAFEDINGIDAEELLAFPENDFVDLVSPSPDIDESHPPECFQEPQL